MILDVGVAENIQYINIQNIPSSIVVAVVGGEAGPAPLLL